MPNDDEAARAAAAPEDSGQVLIHRRLHHELSVILSWGNFAPMAGAWLRHTRLWLDEPDGLTTTLMRQGLAGTALHLAHRPNDEMVGLTFHFEQPPLNVFITGDARKGTVSGRTFDAGVKQGGSAVLFVQTYRASLPEPTTSGVPVEGLDLLGILEQYYARSEQYPARFLELGDHADLSAGAGAPLVYGVAVGLPGVDPQWLAGLTVESFLEYRDEARTIESRSFRFECGCNPARMLAALRSMFGSNPDELFLGEDRVQTSCPRCGRNWWFGRDQFESGAPADAPD